MNRANGVWKAMCLPAKVFPIGMASLILFDIYLGNYRNLGFHGVGILVGTALLYALCQFNMEIVAWFLLALPVFFFIALIALLILDLTFINVTHTFQQRCYPNSVEGEEPTCRSA